MQVCGFEKQMLLVYTAAAFKFTLKEDSIGKKNWLASVLTEHSNADNELLLVLWCDPDSTDETFHTRMSYLCIHKPQHVTAEGLFESLKYGLQSLGIQSITQEACHTLVGITTDGAALNTAGNALKGLVERELEWIFRLWCLAHRLN